MSETPTPEPVATEDGRPTARGWRAIAARLAASMPSKTRKGRGGMQFSYIDARQVMDRLDDVVGPGNWSDSYVLLPDGAVECTLRIFDVAKADVGYKNNPEADEGDAQFEHEPLKAAYSDAFKRAAVKWSIGRFLYR